MNNDPDLPGFLKRMLRAFDKKTPAGLIRGLMMFFLTVYIYEGVVDPDGLQKQTLSYYLLHGLGWPTDKAAAYVLVLVIPWVIKPLYGLISDFIPLFGYRRKSYLILVNLVTSGACFWMATLSDTAVIIMPLFLISLGTAASSALCQAVMVEGGKLTGLTSKFVSQQWLWFSVAGMIVLPLGGFLSDHFGPLAGLHAAALIMGIPPLAVIAATLFLIKEERASISKEQFKSALHGLFSAFASRTLWLVASFIALWFFSPAFGMSMYYFQTKELGFSQEFIGLLGMIGMGGAIVGSILYMFYLRNERTARFAEIMCRVTGISLATKLLGIVLGFVFGWMGKGVKVYFQQYAEGTQEMTVMKALIYISLVCGVLTQASYVMLAGHTSAIVLAIVTSIPQQVALLTSLTLAARACPDKAEGFTYAAIMSMYNFSIQLSSNVGASLYEHTFNHQLAPLALISAGATAVCFLLVPMLPKDSLAKEDHDDSK